MVGRAMAMLIRGMERDPQAAAAGVLVLTYGLSLGAVVLMRWGDANEGTRLLRAGADHLPLTAPVLEVLGDYAERVPGTGGGLMFADAAGHSLRVRDLARRISDLTGDWFPVDTLSAWALAACPELVNGAAARRVVDEFAALGADHAQCNRLAAEFARQRRAAVEEWHGCLAWCEQAATG